MTYLQNASEQHLVFDEIAERRGRKVEAMSDGTRLPRGPAEGFGPQEATFLTDHQKPKDMKERASSGHLPTRT